MSALCNGRLDVTPCYLKMPAGNAPLVQNRAVDSSVSPASPSEPPASGIRWSSAPVLQQVHENRAATRPIGIRQDGVKARAPSSGAVLYVCAVPSMKKGETVANIGVVAARRHRRVGNQGLPGYRFVS